MTEPLADEDTPLDSEEKRSLNDFESRFSRRQKQFDLKLIHAGKQSTNA
jgi:hypothetical protein